MYNSIRASIGALTMAAILALSASCGGASAVMRNIDKPLTYKDFILQNSELENASFVLTDVFVTGMNLYTKVMAGGEECFVIAVSPYPQSNRAGYSFGMQMMGGGGLLIPATNRTLLSRALDLQPGDRLARVTGYGVYGEMKMGMMRMKNSVLSLLVTGIE